MRIGDYVRSIGAGRCWLTMTPATTRHAADQIVAWCRTHRLEPHRCQRIVLFPWLGLVAAEVLSLNETGAFYVRNGGVARRWTLRRLHLPPPADWTVEARS
jgi:hypothetical protein